MDVKPQIKPIARTHSNAEPERVRSALTHLNPNDRDLWVKYGTCVKSEFGEDGFDLWDAWGSQSERHKASSTQSVWKSIGAAGAMTIASLFYDAKQAGWKDSNTYKIPTKAEMNVRKAAKAEQQVKAAAEAAERHKAAAARAQAIWDAALPATEHPYLERKGVLAHGLRVGTWARRNPMTDELETVCDNALLVPIRDGNMKIHSLQAIFPDGSKHYLPGGAKRGHMHVIGSAPRICCGKNVFVLVEGYATGASVHECTFNIVIVCFDAGGLSPVAALLRARQPGAIILFAADNDTGTEGNPGVKAATKAALEVGGLLAVPPSGDFNDLHLEHGAFAVASVVQAVLGAPIISLEMPKCKSASGITA